MAHCWRSFAKINLYLDVLRKRRDGYHHIETLFQSVSLYDELKVSEVEEGIHLSCSLPELECGPSNLVWKAARLLQEKTGCSRGVRIHLQKNIPLAAGLAGGSGNGAATLTALNKLWQLNLSTPQLLACARELGADMSFCLTGGSQAATLKGEALYPLPAPPPLYLVLIHPPITLSAAFIYTHPSLKRSGARVIAGRSSSFRKALRAFKKGDWASLIYNAMEGPAFEEHPQLAAYKTNLLKAGCVAAAMSGSGPTLFGICKSKEEAEHVVATMKEQFAHLQFSIVRPVNRGIEEVPL